MLKQVYLSSVRTSLKREFTTNGEEKNFLSPITTQPWGEKIPKLGELEVPDQEALDSQLLCFEPDALNVETGLPVISKDKLKEGVYY